MLLSNTISKLHDMKLGVMAASFQKQMDDKAVTELNFDDRFSMLVDAEWIARKNNRLKRLIRKADFAYPGASLEDIEYHDDRKLDKTLISRLSDCPFVDDYHKHRFSR